MTTPNRQRSSANGATKVRKARASSADESVGLLSRYRRSRSVNARNQLVERYRGMVEGMARAMAMRLPKSVDVHDLIHAGVWGLMQAIENYDPRIGRHFVPFMRMRVRGAMLDELRNLDFLPRLYRRRQREFDAARDELRRQLERDPSDTELAESLGVSEQRLRRTYSLSLSASGRAAARFADPSAHSVDRDDLETLADTEAHGAVEAVDRRELIETIAASLAPIEWKVLRLHYLEGMSGRDVARKLRLSASRICQIHGRVLSRLKTRLGGTH